MNNKTVKSEELVQFTHGQWLRLLRNAAGLTQDVLWLKSAVPRGTIALLETDATTMNEETATRLAKALDCSRRALVLAAPEAGESNIKNIIETHGIEPNSLCPKISPNHRARAEVHIVSERIRALKATASSAFEGNVDLSAKEALILIKDKGLTGVMRKRVLEQLNLTESTLSRLIISLIFHIHPPLLDGPDIQHLVNSGRAKAVLPTKGLSEEDKLISQLVSRRAGNYLMPNDSMERVGVSIPQGAKLRILPHDRDVSLLDGKVVLVRVKSDHGAAVCIRQLIVDAGRRYLRAWNGGYPTLEVDDKTQVIGCVIKWSMSI